MMCVTFKEIHLEFASLRLLVMATLCNIYIFILWFLLSFFPSPNFGGWRLDVYHTSTYGVALV